ncbi:MAG TPA: VanW family protein [Limnochordia bacterium]|nr:VanW family protein [Limnochordia bacterium]
MRRIAGMLLLITALGVGLPTAYRTIHRRLFGVRTGVYLEDRAMEYYYPGEVRVIVEQMARSRQRPPVPASLDKLTGEIIPHEEGVYFDVDAVVQEVITAPAHTKLDLRGIPVVPLFRTEHLAQLTEVLGDFSTPLMGSPDRVHNIRLSLQAINNTIVMPGEVFSFNEVVGERTPEKGYRNAPIILGEAVVPGVGGGVCQTSTTLYNAVRLAGLEIVERRIHSIAPSYIKHGMDAAVAWPYTDFKFRNSLEWPVIVRAEIQKWRVRVWILGREGSEENGLFR